jgi:hypothetical protein
LDAFDKLLEAVEELELEQQQQAVGPVSATSGI